MRFRTDAKPPAKADTINHIQSQGDYAIAKHFPHATAVVVSDPYAAVLLLQYDPAMINTGRAKLARAYRRQNTILDYMDKTPGAP